MSPGPPKPFPPRVVRALAGLESGVLGSLVVLLWYIVTAIWQDQHWYAMPNLLGSTFYGDRALRSQFAIWTAAGLALHILGGGLAGAIYGSLVPLRLPMFRNLLLALFAGVVWYYVTHVIIWRRLNPLIGVYTAESALMAAHLIFGMCLSRTPGRARRLLLQMYPPPPPIVSPADIVEPAPPVTEPPEITANPSDFRDLPEAGADSIK